MSDADRPWYARVLAFFDVRVVGGWRKMAMLHWLERTAPTHVAGAETYRYWSQHPDVVPVDTIARRVRMMTSPRKRADTHEPCFVLLPYGKWSVS